MNSPTPVVYVFHGQDEPRLKEALTDFCAALFDPATADLNTTRLDGKTVQISDILAAAGALPFLAEVRLVLVENLTESSERKELIDKLVKAIGGLPDWSRVVLVETHLHSHPQDSPAESKRKTARQQALRRLINVVESDPRGKVMSFDPPRDIVRWIVERATRHAAHIEARAARLLAERVGGDLTLADSELAKLAAYTNGQRAINANDVGLLTPYAPEASVFHMVDALGQRNSKEALDLLHRLLAEGSEPLSLFGMIIRQFRLLIQVREHLDGGLSAAGAAQALGIKDFVAKKIAEQARLYRLEQLENIYRHLLNLDLAIKTGKIEPELALETLIARLARSG